MSKSSANPIIRVLRSLWSDQRRFKDRLPAALAASCLLCFTFLFFGPYEVVAFNVSSFTYHHSDIVFTLFAAALAASLCLALVISVLRGKVYNLAAGCVFAAALCIYLQAAFFNGTLGSLTGDAVNWQEQQPLMIVNLIFWAAIFVAVFLFIHFGRKLWRSAVIYVSLLLIFMQSVPAASIFFGLYEETKRSDIGSYNLQTSGMYEFSKGNNVIVFVLDRLDYDYIESTLAEKPDLFASFDGFTQYTNAAPTFARTRPALAHMLNGCEDLAYRTTPETYYKDSWTYGDRNILKDITDQNYTVEIYTEIQDLFSDPEFAGKYVKNLSDSSEKPLPVRVLKRMIILAGYRFAPIALKPFFFKDTIYYNSDVYANQPYSFNDSKHGLGFANIEASREQNSFKFFHFLGTHAPYYLTASGTPSDEKTSVGIQLRGCVHLLNLAFDRMRELGIYKDAAIIITADHGDIVDDELPLQKATRIGMFYKPSGSAGTPITMSIAPVGNTNLPATILKAIGIDYSAYGRALDDIAQDEDLIRTYHKSLSNGAQATNEVSVYTYHIQGDASDFNNWSLVETSDIHPDHKFH